MTAHLFQSLDFKAEFFVTGSDARQHPVVTAIAVVVGGGGIVGGGIVGTTIPNR